jgi:putative tricarboxylic transport membrane protein
LRPLGYDPAPFVLGMILGPILERALRQSLALSGGDPSILIERPLSASIIAAGLIVTLALGLARLRGRFRAPERPATSTDVSK